MSAHKYKSKKRVLQKPITEAERCERFIWRLSKDVSNACDNYQLTKNGYKATGFRGIINASVLNAQSNK